MRIKLFKFSFYYVSASDIAKEVNDFCEEHNVVDIKITMVGDTSPILLCTIIYKE